VRQLSKFLNRGSVPSKQRRGGLNAVSIIRHNQRALRKVGASTADLHSLDVIARAAPSGLARMTGGDLGRITGVSRQTACYHMRRLEALGLILRIGSMVMISVDGLLGIAEMGERARSAVEKLRTVGRSIWRGLAKLSASVSPPATQRISKKKEEEEATFFHSFDAIGLPLDMPLSEFNRVIASRRA